MGGTVRPLLVGYDCPAHAAYLPATIHEAGGSSTREKAICVFERDTGMALSRHSGWMKNEFGVSSSTGATFYRRIESSETELTLPSFLTFLFQAVKGYELIVRSISTVGNYDYVFQTTFMLDGTIEIRGELLCSISLLSRCDLTSSSFLFQPTPVSASGYLQGTVYTADQAAFGTRIRESSMGSLHDHVRSHIPFHLALSFSSLT